MKKSKYIRVWLRKTGRLLRKTFRWVRHLNPWRLLPRLDRYIISKFIGTYIYSIILIISIAIVFDVNENLSKFTTLGAPLKAIVFDYYANFVPYFSNLFSPLFVFIAVIFFTSKLAGNSEIIAMLAAGVSFKRLLRPYILSAAMIALVNFYLGAYIIPHGTVVRQEFEAKYRNSKKITSASNVQLMIRPGVIAYIQQYDNNTKTGYGFSLDKFENKKLPSSRWNRWIWFIPMANKRLLLPMNCAITSVNRRNEDRSMSYSMRWSTTSVSPPPSHPLS